MALPDDVIANTLAKYTEIFKILTGADPCSERAGAA